MKVNGRNDLVIATFLGIKGEAGRIPPLEIWVMHKEAVRYSFLDQNGAFENCQHWNQSCRELLLSEWITRISGLCVSWVDAVWMYAKFWCATQTTNWCPELFGQCHHSFKISLSVSDSLLDRIQLRLGGWSRYCWGLKWTKVECVLTADWYFHWMGWFLLLETCLRRQHWPWKIPQDAVTRAVQKVNAESFWINLPKISIKILGVSIIQVDSSDPSGPLIHMVFSSKYDTNENSH